MELEETFTSQFTSSTTCYSGAKQYLIDYDDDDGGNSSSSPVDEPEGKPDHVNNNNHDKTSLSSTSTSQQQPRRRFRLATESHILDVTLGESIETSSEVIPRDAPQLIGVGCSTASSTLMMPPNTQSTTRQQHSNSKNHYHATALALMDPTILDPLPDEVLPPLFQPPEAEAMSVMSASVIDASSSRMSVTAAMTGSTRNMSKMSADGSLHGSTRSLSKASVDGTGRGGGGQDGSMREMATTVTSSTAAVTATARTSTTGSPPSSRLWLQVNRAAPNENDLMAIQGHSHKDYYTVALDYRPLSPCLCPLGDDTIGIWVGSADDPRLRLYAPETPTTNNTTQNQGNDDAPPISSSPSPGSSSLPEPPALVNLHQERLLGLKSLPDDPAFVVDTPVMGLGYCAWGGRKNGNDGDDDSTTHTLVAACQDGTIQLISWQGGDTFQNLCHSTFIVDGPLVNVHLHETTSGALRVLVGSLCGYVCQLVTSHSNSPSSQQSSDDNESSGASSSTSRFVNWGEPTMVVQGLWNDELSVQDSVLALDAVGEDSSSSSSSSFIAVGTQSGRCLLYRARGVASMTRFIKLWECTLPYSIHGLVIVQQDFAAVQLIVTTRRSLHVFETSRVPLEFARQPRYSAALAKRRLDELLQASRKNTPASSPKRGDTDNNDQNDAEPLASTQGELDEEGDSTPFKGIPEGTSLDDEPTEDQPLVELPLMDLPSIEETQETEQPPEGLLTATDPTEGNEAIVDAVLTDLSVTSSEGEKEQPGGTGGGSLGEVSDTSSEGEKEKAARGESQNL